MAYIPPNPNGQAVMASSAPVVIASNQTAVPVSLAAIPGVSDITATGTLGALSATVALSVIGGYSGAVIQITGTWVGTIQFEATANNVDWVTVNAVIAGSAAPGPTTTVNGIVRVTPAGMSQIRVIMSAYTSGTATVLLRASQGMGGTFLNQSLTVGANIIGKVGIDQTTPGTTNLVALAANQSVNTAQINGVAPLMGNGVTGTGSPRVTIASDNTPFAIAEARAATLHITATALVNTGATATLPAPAAGLFHYITRVELVKLYAVIGVAAGAGVIITSTNLPGSQAWTTEQLASAAGTAARVIAAEYARPLKSSVAATATTFVAPLQLQTIWRWNISYFTAA